MHVRIEPLKVAVLLPSRCSEEGRDLAVSRDVLGGDGALSFSLNDSIMGAGKVWPFSQISMSFLIFSYTARNNV